MARVQITGGVLEVEGMGGPVDPGYGGGIGAGRPDNSLPPGFPPIGSTLPEPPPGVWPPLTGWAPIQPAPPGTPPGSIWPPIGRPDRPGNALPTPPGRPPQVGGGPADPVGRPPQVGGGPATPPGRPDAGLPPSPGRPDAGLPPQPGHPDAGLPVQPGHPGGGPVPPQGSTKPPSGVYYIVAGIPGVGWRYVAVDPSLEAGMPLPEGPPGHVSGQPIPNPPGHVSGQPVPPAGAPPTVSNPVAPTPEPRGR